MQLIGRFLIGTGCLTLFAGVPVSLVAVAQEPACIQSCDNLCRERAYFHLQFPDNSIECREAQYATCQYCKDGKCCPKETDVDTDKVCKTAAGKKLDGTIEATVQLYYKVNESCRKNCNIPAGAAISEAGSINGGGDWKIAVGQPVQRCDGKQFNLIY